MYLGKSYLSYVFVTFFSLSFANDDADVCGDMPVIPHTTIDSQGKQAPFDVGFRSRIRCVDGYITGGKLLYLKCVKKEEAAIWQYEENPCRPRSCGFPNEVENAIRIGHSFTFPNNVTYVCRGGFKLRGTPTVPCLHTGHWGPSFPTCEETTCPLLPHPPNGQVKTAGLQYGDTATYQCDRGFTMEGPNQRICAEDAEWSDEAPLCKAATCSPPTGFENGRIINIKDVYYYTDMIIFFCNTGERRTSRCLRDGIWSADPPTCPGPTTTRTTKTETPSTSSSTTTVKTESSSTSSPAVNRTELSDLSTTNIVKTETPSTLLTTAETEASSATSPSGSVITARAPTSTTTANVKPEVSTSSATVYCPREITTANDGRGSKLTWPKTIYGTEVASVPPCIKEDNSPFLRSCLKSPSGGDAHWEKLDGVCSKQDVPDVLGHDCTASENDGFAFEITTYIGCGFSILALALIVLTFLLFREWRQENKNKILFNLCIALIMVLVVFTVCFKRSHSPAGSWIAAAFFHYFLLAAFAWVLVEAGVHYLIVVKDRLNYIHRIMMVSIICAWGSPILIVSLLLVFHPSAYDGFRSSCWNSSGAFPYAFGIPVGGMLLITFVMQFLVLCSLNCGPHGSNAYDMNGKQPHTKRLQTSICVSVLLGLSCIFVLLAVNNTRPVFQLLFALTIALEGLLIFVNSVLRERPTLELWKDLLLRSRENRISPIAPINDLNCGVSMLQIMKEQNVYFYPKGS